uniref:Tf2-1-like SH3-like domain-containing protein n=1 Tax=Moniliophthora roreri TaxID=221103 RepID=A0A0W0FHZ2_MONRR
MAFECTNILSIEECLQELKRVREETMSLLELARQQMIQWEKRKLEKFKVGQKVWLEGKNLAIRYPTKKLALKREGPFKILEVLRPVTYKLDLPHQWKIHPVFHAALLTPFKETEAHRPSFTEPPPDLIEGFKEYEVEVIIGHRLKKIPPSSTASDKGQMGMDTLVQTLQTLKTSSHDLPLNPKLSRNNSLPLLMRPLNLQPQTPSFILTPLPIPTSNLRLNVSTTPPLESLPNPMTPLPAVFKCLNSQFHPETKIVPIVGREVQEGDLEDEDRENQIPSNISIPLRLNLQPPTPVPTPMTQLINCVSALCADWSAILPGIACSTCVSNASKLSLGILLEAALTTEGLARLCIEGLIRVLALCWTIAIMTMNLMTILMENSDEEMAGDNGDMDFMFIGSDPQKVGRFMGYLSVEEQEHQG